MESLKTIMLGTEVFQGNEGTENMLCIRSG